jgi:hypothetical protein
MTSRAQTQSTTDTESKSRSIESRDAASFSAGLRLDSSPFPQAPAGALLAVVVPQGSHEALYEQHQIYVLDGPYRQIDIHEEASVYLVVNDARCSAPFADGGGALHVEVMRKIPAQATAKAAFRAHEAALQSLQERTKTLIQQGEYAKEEIPGLKMALLATLEQACSQEPACDIHALPPPLSTLFDYWITNELNNLRLKINIVSLEDHLARIYAKINALLKHITYKDDQIQASAQLIRWALSDVDRQALGWVYQKLGRYLVEDYLPAIRFRYPQLVEKFVQDPVVLGMLQALIDAAADVDAYTLYGQLQKLVEHLLLTVKQMEARYPLPTMVNVAVSIPLPCELDPECTTQDGAWATRPSELPFKTLDKTRARALWQGLLQRRADVPLTLVPEDLYGKSGQALIGCSTESPVIEGMAVAFITSGMASSGTAFEPRSAMWTDRQFTYPKLEGPQSTFIANGRWTHFSVPYIYGPIQQTLGKLDEKKVIDVAAAKGLSPFGTYHFNFSEEVLLHDLKWGSDALGLIDENNNLRFKQIVLLFKVMVPSNNAPLAWIRTCR